MSIQFISEEEVERLRTNPNVASVSVRQLVLTPEFKQQVYDEMVEGGRIKEVLVRHGIDPEALGETRVNGIRDKIVQQAARPEGFQNLRQSGQQPATSKEKSLEKQVRELQHQLAYTQQEVEFLKKIRMADLEAQRQWESKHRQK